MSGRVVETTSGSVEGVATGHGVVFRGIPYGDSGIEHRFLAPGPVRPWAGVRPAHAFGPPAPQPPQLLEGVARAEAEAEFARTFGALGYTLERGPVVEDCLVLNVWTSGDATTRHPVLVWVHGGGLVDGSGAAPVFDMARLAERGEIVVVTLNHRLGILGYSHLPELLGERYAASAGAATLDLVAALRWVRDNIAGFGGDPGRVTVAGESGGGAKIASLLGAESARGLFHGAVLRSGVALRLPRPAEMAEVVSRALSVAGIDPSDAAILTTVDVAELLRIQERFGIGMPVLDGATIREHPVDAVRDGLARDIPLLIGTTADEAGGNLAPYLDGAREGLGARLGDAFDAIRTEYADSRRGESEDAILEAILSDGFRIPSIRIAESRASGSGAPVFMYRFAKRNPQHDPPRADHSSDTPYFFDTLAAAPAVSGVPGAQRLADHASAALAAFVRTGDPSTPGLPDWPAYDLASRATMRLDDESAIENDPGRAVREAWVDGADI